MAMHSERAVTRTGRHMVAATLAFAVLLLAACGDDAEGGGTGASISAMFTLTDGTTFAFSRPATMTLISGLWNLEAFDASRRYGLVIAWSEGTVTGPGEYDADMGVSRLQVWIIRPGSDASNTTLSTISEGRITFDEVSYEPGATVSGTFDDVLLERDDPDDETVRIQVMDGTFSARIP